jgi:hypothetical protein
MLVRQVPLQVKQLITQIVKLETLIN